jgi:hypothetical protein
MARRRVQEETEIRAAETVPAPEESKPAGGFKVTRVNSAGALKPELEAMVTRIIVPTENILPLYERLESALHLGENRTEYGFLLEALDSAELNARAAHKLLTTAQINRREWEIESEATMASLRAEATKSMQAEKDAGTRSKAITEGDIAAKCAELFPDEWRAQLMRGERLKRLVDSIENLVEVWNSRCRSLQTMLGKHRV